MKKNLMVVIGGLIMAAAILSILVAAAPGSSGIELTLKELVENQDKYKDDYLTVEGLLIQESVKWDADSIMLEFDVKDDEGNILHVKHNGVKPDNFSVEGVTVILQGYPDAAKQGSFTAEVVKTRCPSKYEGQDMKNYDPEMHKDMAK